MLRGGKVDLKYVPRSGRGLVLAVRYTLAGAVGALVALILIGVVGYWLYLILTSALHDLAGGSYMRLGLYLVLPVVLLGLLLGVAELSRAFGSAKEAMPRPTEVSPFASSDPQPGVIYGRGWFEACGCTYCFGDDGFNSSLVSPCAAHGGDSTATVAAE